MRWATTDSQTKKCPQSKPDRTRRKQLEKTIYIVIFLDFHSIACVQTSPLPQEKSGEETSMNRRR